MDSRNRTPRNDKQEELIKRLEEIRKQRDTVQPTTRQSKETISERRNQNQQPREQRDRRNQSKSNQNQQKNTQRRNTQTIRQTTIQQDPTPMKEIKMRTQDYFSDNTIAHEEIQDDIREKGITRGKKYSKTNRAKPLLNQLSNGENLAQAIILNEVLSKPIALRY